MITAMDKGRLALTAVDVMMNDWGPMNNIGRLLSG